MIGRRDHGGGRSVISLQGINRWQAVFPGLEIGVKVSTPEAIDRLFRVTDQDEGLRGFIVGGVVNPIEDAVLDGISILKLIDERDRELLPNQRGKMGAVRSLECGIEMD